jgi:hypothetical protein
MIKPKKATTEAKTMMQSAEYQRSYIVAKSLPTIIYLSTTYYHSDRYKFFNYPDTKIIKI